MADESERPARTPQVNMLLNRAIETDAMPAPLSRTLACAAHRERYVSLGRSCENGRAEVIACLLPRKN